MSPASHVLFLSKFQRFKLLPTASVHHNALAVTCAHLMSHVSCICMYKSEYNFFLSTFLKLRPISHSCQRLVLSIHSDCTQCTECSKKCGYFPRNKIFEAGKKRLKHGHKTHKCLCTAKTLAVCG